MKDDIKEKVKELEQKILDIFIKINNKYCKEQVSSPEEIKIGKDRKYFLHAVDEEKASLIADVLEESYVFFGCKKYCHNYEEKFKVYTDIYEIISKFEKKEA